MRVRSACLHLGPRGGHAWIGVRLHVRMWDVGCDAQTARLRLRRRGASREVENIIQKITLAPGPLTLHELYRAHPAHKNLQARASRGTATRVSRLSRLHVTTIPTNDVPWVLAEKPMSGRRGISQMVQRDHPAHICQHLTSCSGGGPRPTAPHYPGKECTCNTEHMPTWPGTGAFASFCCNSPHIVSAVITTGQRSRVARRSGGRQDRGRRASGGRDSAARAPERAAPC